MNSLDMIQPLRRLPLEYSRVQMIKDLFELFLLNRLLEDEQIEPAETGQVEAEPIGIKVNVIGCWYKGIEFEYF